MAVSGEAFGEDYPGAQYNDNNNSPELRHFSLSGELDQDTPNGEVPINVVNVDSSQKMSDGHTDKESDYLDKDKPEDLEPEAQNVAEMTKRRAENKATREYLLRKALEADALAASINK